MASAEATWQVSTVCSIFQVPGLQQRVTTVPAGSAEGGVSIGPPKTVNGPGPEQRSRQGHAASTAATAWLVVGENYHRVLLDGWSGRRTIAAPPNHGFSGHRGLRMGGPHRPAQGRRMAAKQRDAQVSGHWKLPRVYVDRGARLRRILTSRAGYARKSFTMTQTGSLPSHRPKSGSDRRRASTCPVGRPGLAMPPGGPSLDGQLSSAARGRAPAAGPAREASPSRQTKRGPAAASPAAPRAQHPPRGRPARPAAPYPATRPARDRSLQRGSAPLLRLQSAVKAGEKRDPQAARGPSKKRGRERRTAPPPGRLRKPGAASPVPATGRGANKPESPAAPTATRPPAARRNLPPKPPPAPPATARPAAASLGSRPREAPPSELPLR